MVNNIVMSKFKFINLFDAIFLSIASLFIVFVWIQFFVKNIILSLIFSIFITLGIIVVFKWLKNKKMFKLNQLVSKSNNLILFKLAIQTMPNTKLNILIKKLIPKQYLAKTVKGDIIFTKNNCNHLITTYFQSDLTEYKLLEIVKTKSAANINLICTNFSPEVGLISKAFKNKTINLITIEQLFEMFTNKNITIDTSNIDLSKHKITLKETLKNSLSRNKSKGYFISGLVLLFTSIIIPYKIYYVVFSSVLFLLSILCRFKPTVKHSRTLFD